MTLDGPQTDPGITLSVVLPVYNEADNLPALDRRLRDVLAALPYRAEIVYADDGSQDHSPRLLQALAAAHPESTRVVLLRRNFGQTAAISAGMDHARGQIIVLLDADLQNDPADIPMLVAKLDEGYDVVSGWRRSRQDNLIRRLPSQVANRLISAVTGVHLHDYGCTLKAYRAEVMRGVRLYGEMHRFIPVFAHAAGARITEVVVRHHPRTAGRSSYGLGRTFKVILDLITVKFLSSYGTRPMYIFGGFGILMILLALIAFGIAVLRFHLEGVFLIESPLPTLAGVLGAVGVQSILLGLTTELLMRTYHESQGKAAYTVRRVIGDEADGQDVPPGTSGSITRGEIRSR